MTEAAILKILFPPDGAIPLACIDTLPQIRSYIAALTALARHQPLPKVPGAHRVNDPVESMAITLRIIELHDNERLTWAEIAERIGQGITGGACRHRYQNYMRDVAKKPTEVTICASEQKSPPVTEPDQKTEELTTIRKSRTVEKTGSLSPETLAEVDRMLAEGVGVQEISRELGRRGMSAPWTKVRARAAYLARVKGKGNAEMPGETSTEQHKLVETAPLQEAGSEQIESATEQERKPEPVSISRAELDRRIWDMWRAGKTLDEISDTLYSEGLYYSAKSVRVRLLNQGAKL